MAKLKNGPLDNLDDVAEGHRDLYSKVESGENAGKYILAGVETGYTATQTFKQEAANVRLQLKNSTDKVTELTTKMSAWGDLNSDEVRAKLARIEELEAAAKGKVPEDKLNELATARANALTAEITTKLKKTQENLDTALKLNDTYKRAEDNTKILAAVGVDAKTLGFQDATFISPQGALSLMALSIFGIDAGGKVGAKEGSGFDVGLPPSEVLPKILENHPYLGKPSEGSGSKGSGSGSVNGQKNVFTDPNLDVRMALKKSNPAEYDRQFKASGLPDQFKTVAPKQPTQ